MSRASTFLVGGYFETQPYHNIVILVLQDYDHAIMQYCDDTILE